MCRSTVSSTQNAALGFLVVVTRQSHGGGDTFLACCSKIMGMGGRSKSLKDLREERDIISSCNRKGPTMRSLEEMLKLAIVTILTH